MTPEERITELENELATTKSELLRARIVSEFRGIGLDENYASLATSTLISERGEKDLELLPELIPNWISDMKKKHPALWGSVANSPAINSDEAWQKSNIELLNEARKLEPKPQKNQTTEEWMIGRIRRGELSTEELMQLSPATLSAAGNLARTAQA